MIAHLTGRHILFAMLGFFGVVIAVNTVFVFAAVGTFRGEDAPGAYLQGLDFNRTLEARAAQARLGWRATIGASRTARRTTRFEVTLRDKAGSPLVALSLTGALDHPSDAKRDRTAVFKPNGDGVYAATLSDVEPGGWDIVVRAKAPDGTLFEARQRLWLQ